MNINPLVVIFTSIGLLIVILNKPLGEAGYRRSVELGGKDYGVWWYRGPILVAGLILVLMSFLYER